MGETVVSLRAHHTVPPQLLLTMESNQIEYLTGLKARLAAVAQEGRKEGRAVAEAALGAGLFPELPLQMHAAAL